MYTTIAVRVDLISANLPLWFMSCPFQGGAYQQPCRSWDVRLTLAISILSMALPDP
jgi:hypothetical protein